MMRNKRAWLCDLDGTLLDSSPELIACANLVAKAYAQQGAATADLLPLAAEGAAALLAVSCAPLWQTASAELQATLVAEFLALYAKLAPRAPLLFAGVAPALAAWQAQGGRLVIITNKLRYLSEPIIAASPLGQYCELLICADDLSAPKPAPEGINLALAKLKLSAADCVFIGDDFRDARAASSAGVDFVHARYACYCQDLPELASAKHVLATSSDWQTLLASGAKAT